MALQDTIAAADAVVLLINAATITEAIGDFSRTFVPEFEPNDLPAPKGLVFPAGQNLTRADRNSDNEDNVIEVGIGRKLTGADAETTDIETQMLTVEEVIAELRKKANKRLTLAGGEVLAFRKLSVTLFVPELFRKHVALSVVRIEYRGFSA